VEPIIAGVPFVERTSGVDKFRSQRFPAQRIEPVRGREAALGVIALAACHGNQLAELRLRLAQFSGHVRTQWLAFYQPAWSKAADQALAMHIHDRFPA
jgi:hypothetical protein